MGDVMGDLNRRRGLVQGMEDSPSGKVIRAEVPLGEMFGYATDVRSMSQGRASYSMEFSKYAEAPMNIAEAIIKTMEESNDRPLGVEGLDEGRWVLIDANDVIIHVFAADSRDDFSLERLWSDAPLIPFQPEESPES